MRKLWISAILIIFVLAGCGANPGGYEDASTTEDTTTTTGTTTTVMTTTTTPKPTTTAPTTTKKPIQKVQVEGTTTVKTEATKKVLEEKTVSIDVKTQNPFGEMSIFQAKTGCDLQYVSITFSYKLTADKRLYPKSVTARDKNQNDYSMLNFGATPSKTLKNENGEIIGYEYNDTIGVFREISDNIDLSHVTITYAFEGYDPVTVEFDIPGI